MTKKAMASHIKLGRLGENTALALLRFKNMELLARNYRTASGELDLVVRDGGVLVFVEVKTLRRPGRYRPLNNLHFLQIRRNYRAGRRYLRQLGQPENLPCRFDLVEVVRDFRRIYSVVHHVGYVSAAPLLLDRGRS